jgi:hypothetical protein
MARFWSCVHVLVPVVSSDLLPAQQVGSIHRSIVSPEGSQIMGLDWREAAVQVIDHFKLTTRRLTSEVEHTELKQWTPRRWPDQLWLRRFARRRWLFYRDLLNEHAFFRDLYCLHVQVQVYSYAAYSAHAVLRPRDKLAFLGFYCLLRDVCSSRIADASRKRSSVSRIMVARFGYLNSEYTYCMPVLSGSCQPSSEGYTAAYCISYSRLIKLCLISSQSIVIYILTVPTLASRSINRLCHYRLDYV